jgi:hypothetical protein
MSFITIKSKIKSILQGVSKIEQVSDYPNQDFSGFPAVMIRTNGNTSNYETTQENDEIYSFSLFVFQIIEGVYSAEKARNILEEMCDLIRDTFDSDEFLNGISMPSGRSILGVRPTVSSIGEDDSGKYCIAEIELAVRVSKFV